MDEPMGDEQMAPPVPEDEMGDMSNEEMPEEGGDDSTMSIINQLSDEDKESVRAYAESMLKKNGEDNEENGEEAMPEDEENMAPPVPEGKTFTKKQLKEEFGVKVDKNTEVKNSPQPKEKKINKNNPFNPPIFN